MLEQINITQTHTQELAKVLIVSAYAHPHIGGVEVVVDQQARTLADLGHKVTLVTSHCGASRAAKEEEVNGYTVVRIPAWNLLEESIGVPFPVWDPRAVRQVANLIRRSDVVHVHDVYYGSSILAASLARRHRRPLFVTQHVGIVEHDLACVKLVQRLVYSLAGRKLWHWAERITVYNRIAEEFLHRYGVSAGKISLNYNGIDTKYFRPGIRDKSLATRQRYGLSPDLPIVLSVSRLVPKKGFQKLVEARSAEYLVVHAGPGVVPSHVPEGVHFLGPLNRSELRDLYQASAIFAFPAVGEMLTLVMMEAMACGLPIVAAAEEAYSRYDLDPSGIALVEPEPETLRAAFLEILGDPARMDYMQKYARWLSRRPL